MPRSLPLAVVAVLCAGAGAHARTLEAGQGKQYESPSAAISAAQEGDRVAIYPGQYFDCAVIQKNNITVEGVGNPEQIVMTDKACEGKALLVIRGENVTIRNMTLTRVRVPDENGAGIRGESRKITIDNVRFINNQNGILSGTTGGSMIIRNSLFDKNGSCGSACAHGLYVGHLDLLHVENTRFYDTQHAHHIKSRAARTEVIGCDIEDGPQGNASYEVEAPNGGSVIVRNSKIIKGPNAENHTAAIMIGSEGVTQMTPEIIIENNTFRNDGTYPTIFVDNLTATEAQLSGNNISGVGPVRPLKGDGKVVASR
ncbi:MAG: right-handed parallel beta-helix repeat-containing protein [Acetobacteraceae bacterium]|nr:right-handed parallel beta-helix repeat-containing protein [Acetobacteraceae bacterium]